MVMKLYQNRCSQSISHRISAIIMPISSFIYLFPDSGDSVTWHLFKMAYLCGKLFSRDPFASMEKREPPIVDLDKVISDWVWENLDIPALCCCRPDRCKKKGLQLKIDWSVIDREDVVQKFTILPDHVSPPKAVQLFRTKFHNNSGQPQVFTFKTQRQTQTSVEMSVQQGLSIGGRFQMAFPLVKPSLPENAATAASMDPDDFQLTSSLGGHITWNVNVGEKMTKQETMTWGVDSQVQLNDGERAVATLKVMEAKLVGLLTLKTIIKVTSYTKKIPVDVIDKKTGEIVATVDLSCKCLCDSRDDFELMADRSSFCFTTIMTCKTVYGVEQVAAVRLLGEDEDVDEEEEARDGHGDGAEGGVRVEEVIEPEENVNVSMTRPLIKCA